MRPDGQLIHLTWKEWDEAVGHIPGFGMNWFQRLLKHPQHWFLNTFGGHTSVAEQEFRSRPIPFRGSNGSPADRPGVRILTPAEIEAILAEEPKTPRPGPNPWQQMQGWDAGKSEDNAS